MHIFLTKNRPPKVPNLKMIFLGDILPTVIVDALSRGDVSFKFWLLEIRIFLGKQSQIGVRK